MNITIPMHVKSFQVTDTLVPQIVLELQTPEGMAPVSDETLFIKTREKLNQALLSGKVCTVTIEIPE